MTFQKKPPVENPRGLGPTTTLPTPIPGLVSPYAKSPDAPAPPELPPSSEGLTPKEQAKKMVDWLEARIRFAEANKASAQELSAWVARHTAAVNLLAKLSGSFDVTHSTILRSAPWGTVMQVLRKVWAKHPEALRDLVDALEELEQTGNLERADQ